MRTTQRFKEQLDFLRENFEIQAVDPSTMTLMTVRYDALHMGETALNRKHVVTFLTGAAEAPIGYLAWMISCESFHVLQRKRCMGTPV